MDAIMVMTFSVSLFAIFFLLFLLGVSQYKNSKKSDLDHTLKKNRSEQFKRSNLK